MQHDQGGRKQLFSPAQAADLLPSAKAVDEQIAKAAKAVAGAATAFCAYAVVAVGLQ